MNTELRRARGQCPLCNSTQFEAWLDAENRLRRARCYYNRCPQARILAAPRGISPGQRDLSVVVYDAAKNRAAAKRTWELSRDVEGTLAEQYLRRRNITLERLPASLRYSSNVSTIATRLAIITIPR